MLRTNRFSSDFIRPISQKSDTCRISLATAVHISFRKTLNTSLLGLAVLAGVPFTCAAQNVPAFPAASLPARELDQVIDSVRQERQMQSLQRAEKLTKEQSKKKLQKKLPAKDSFVFMLNGVKHTGSEVLTEEEFEKTVSPWIGKKVTSSDLIDLLKAIDTLYHSKGYAVCKATLQPQKLTAGVLTVTLIEGKTDKVKVKGAPYTRDSYILQAFDLPENRVANYAKMVDDLIKFNMTNSLQLHIDIEPGSRYGTTSYNIIADDQPYWYASLFSDTYGSYSTGKLRVSGTLELPSMTGMQDSFTAMVIKSQGSLLGYTSYSLPLSATGTRLIFSASGGNVKVKKGPSRDLNVKGRSSNYSLQLEKAFVFSSQVKITPYIQISKKKSHTFFFVFLLVAKTTIDSMTLGADALKVGTPWTLYGHAELSRHHSTNEVYNQTTNPVLFRSSGYGRWDEGKRIFGIVKGSIQSVLGGGDTLSSDYFYLGQTSGVRGYPIDIIGAENGWTINSEMYYRFQPWNLNAKAFFDFGRLSGYSINKQRWLAGTGIGLDWYWRNNLSSSLTLSFPLKRHLRDKEVEHISRGRLDFSLTYVF